MTPLLGQYQPVAKLHLDALNRLLYVLQEGLVLRALVLVLVSVHVCQSAHISVKVLLVHRLLWNRSGSLEVGKQVKQNMFNQTHNQGLRQKGKGKEDIFREE